MLRRCLPVVVHRPPRSGVSPARSLVRDRSVALKDGTGRARSGAGRMPGQAKTWRKATRTVCLTIMPGAKSRADSRARLTGTLPAARRYAGPRRVRGPRTRPRGGPRGPTRTGLGHPPIRHSPHRSPHRRGSARAERAGTRRPPRGRIRRTETAGTPGLGQPVEVGPERRPWHGRHRRRRRGGDRAPGARARRASAPPGAPGRAAPVALRGDAPPCEPLLFLVSEIYIDKYRSSRRFGVDVVLIAGDSLRDSLVPELYSGMDLPGDGRDGVGRLPPRMVGSA